MKRLSRWFSTTIIILAAVSSQCGHLLPASAHSAVQNHRVQSLNGSVNNVLNVMASPYNARGDGNTDDLNAIQQAIYDGEGATPPTFPTTNGRTIYLPRTPTGKCYEISKPLRVASGPIEIKGDSGSCITKTYAGPTIITEAWGTGYLTYGPALVGTGASISTVGYLSSNWQHGIIDLSQNLNGTFINLATAFSTGFDIEFWMKPTTLAGGNVLGSEPANPSTSGIGMFKFTQNGAGAISAIVNTTGGLVSLTACSNQSTSTAYDMALDWDKSTYRLGLVLKCTCTRSVRGDDATRSWSFRLLDGRRCLLPSVPGLSG